MAITDKEQGVWDVDEVYNKINQGGIWEYNGAPGEPGGVWQTRSTWYGRLGMVRVLLIPVQIVILLLCKLLEFILLHGQVVLLLKQGETMEHYGHGDIIQLEI